MFQFLFIPFISLLMPGFIGALLGAVSGLSSILGGASKSAAETRAAQERNQLTRDRLNLERYGMQQDLPGQRLNTGGKASLIRNFQPSTAEWGGPGSGKKGQAVKFSGGFSNPDIYKGDYGRQADDVAHQMLQAQLARGNDMPTISGPQKSGFWDKLLGGAAFGSSILSGLRGPGYDPHANDDE